MKTIVDIINYMLSEIDCIYTPHNCSLCNMWRWCSVNTTILSVSMAQQAGEYH